MGMTIVQRSNLRQKKHNAKIALVLAGGAVSGGAYELGGLKALNDYLLNRKVTDFDIYVGLSAGAFLAAPLAGGIGPEEMLRSIDGSSDRFAHLSFLDFYLPNVGEFVKRPLEATADYASILPRVALRAARWSPQGARRAFYATLRWLAVGDASGLEQLLEQGGRELFEDLSLRNPLAYLPSGLCDNRRLERYLRLNLQRNGLPNDFIELRQQTGKALYVLATRLDTAQRVVFGPDTDHSVTISEAVQASTALPGFYRPAHLHGQDFIDGGVCKTANISVAVEAGARLVICYNPFRPFYNHVEYLRDPRTGQLRRKGRPLAEEGILMVLNQVFRTVLRSRLLNSIRRYEEDPNFDGDILLIEPTDYDYKFFGINPVAFWKRARSAQHGFESAKKSIERNFTRVRRILNAYGIEMTRRFVCDNMTRFEANRGDEHAILGVLQTETPRLDMKVL